MGHDYQPNYRHGVCQTCGYPLSALRSDGVARHNGIPSLDTDTAYVIRRAESGSPFVQAARAGTLTAKVLA